MRRTTPLAVSEEDRGLLLSWLGSAGLSARIRLRARIVIASAGGQGARGLARDLGVSVETVYLWRRRYERQGIEGLRSLSLPGRRSQIDGHRAGAILRAGRARVAGGSTRSVAAVARASGVSRSTVRRLWDQQGLSDALTPRRVAAPRDPVASPSRIVGIFIDPPWRLIARMVPAPRSRDGLASSARPTSRRIVGRIVGRPEAGLSANALVTALEAFGADTWGRRAPAEASAGLLDDFLVKLLKISGGFPLEILDGPRTGNPRGTPGAPHAPRVAEAAMHVVRARTRGAWLARATSWLRAAPEAQEPALAGVLGHLMDYFASWNEKSPPFVWTPSQPPRPRVWPPTRAPQKTA